MVRKGGKESDKFSVKFIENTTGISLIKLKYHIKSKI